MRTTRTGKATKNAVLLTVATLLVGGPAFAGMDEAWGIMFLVQAGVFCLIALGVVIVLILLFRWLKSH